MTRKFNTLQVEEVSRTRLMAEEAKGNLVELCRLRTKNELEAVSKVEKFGEAAGVWWSLLRRLQSFTAVLLETDNKHKLCLLANEQKIFEDLPRVFVFDQERVRS